MAGRRIKITVEREPTIKKRVTMEGLIVLNTKVVEAEVNAVCAGCGLEYANEPETVKAAMRGCLLRGYSLRPNIALSQNQSSTIQPTSKQGFGEGILAKLKSLDDLV